jgi:hypothetical protein
VVSNIYTIIIVLKLKHELGIGDLTLLERRRGCGGIPKLVVLLVLALFFFSLCHVLLQTK